MNHKKLVSALGFVVMIVMAVFLQKVFSGEIVLQQSFVVLGFQIHFYGLILAIAILAAYWLLKHRAKQFSIPSGEVENSALVMLIGGFLGARLYHVVSSLDYYLQNWSEILSIWNGGLSIFGAVMGGLFALWLYHRYYDGENFLRILDWITPSVVVGQIIGRFGNFVNYEAYGSPTELPWKMFVPIQFRFSEFVTTDFFHPVFLYESLAGLLILLILLNWTDIAKFLKIRFQVGQIFWIWLGLYSLVRMGTETLRLDSPYLGNLKQNFLVSLVVLGLSGFFLIRSIIKAKHESK